MSDDGARKHARRGKRRRKTVSLVLDFNNEGFFTAADASGGTLEVKNGAVSAVASGTTGEYDDETEPSSSDSSSSSSNSGTITMSGDYADEKGNVKEQGVTRDKNSEESLPYLDDASATLCRNHHSHHHRHHHKRRENREERRSNALPSAARLLIIMMVMVGTYAVAEVVAGFATKSLSMLSDSFHMLSDMLSLIVGFVAMWLAAKRQASANKTYGWKRAEVIGGLINGVFLVSVCFYTVTEAIVRLIEGPPLLRDPWLIFGVGVGGLVVNLVGMCMFCSHRTLSHHHGHAHGHSHSHGHADSTPPTAVGEERHQQQQQHSEGSNVNLHGVFLHVLGDALGSLVVIATALVYILVKDGDQNEGDETMVAPWKPYLDPVCSILFSLFILRAAIPLLRHTVNVLMQSVPDHCDLDDLRNDLLALNGVEAVHELHVWQQSAGDIVGTVHFETAMSDETECHALHRQVKKTFCKYGVHRTTVQRESLQQSCYAKSRDIGGNSVASDRDNENDDKNSCCQMSSSSSASSFDSLPSLSTRE